MEKNLIGRKIRIYRAMQKPPMSQANLLAKIHLQGLEISQSTLSKIENEERFVTDFELLAIAKAMDVDIMWLLEEKEGTIGK
jgi:transcriptional regulator with XRE-family HTH domain